MFFEPTKICVYGILKFNYWEKHLNSCSSGAASGVARTFPGVRYAQPEDQNEEENEKERKKERKK